MIMRNILKYVVIAGLFVSWTYPDGYIPASFTLYENGVDTNCVIAGTDNSINCTYNPKYGKSSYTMTAWTEDGIESDPSPVYPLIVKPPKATIVNMEKR